MHKFPLYKVLAFFNHNESKKRPTLKKIVLNSAWLFTDKIFRMGVALFVVGWIGNYLGPDKFGVLNYATAFVALFNPIAIAGLNAIVVRDIVRYPQEAMVIMGSAFGCSLSAGFIAVILCSVLIFFITPEDPVTIWMVAILSLTMIFNSFDVVTYWFQSQVQSRFSVIAKNFGFAVSVLLTVYLITIKASVVSFAFIRTVEFAFYAIGLIIVYKFAGNRISEWKFVGKRAKQLITDSWALILTGMAVMTYMRIDQIMIGEIIGRQSVGYYSAAVRVSEVLYFIPTSIVNSAFPSIVEAKNISDKLYKKRIQKLCNALSAISYLVVIPISFWSGDIINIIFGPQYVKAGNVLSVHIWAAVFVFLGIARRSWMNTEGLMKYTFISTAIGAMLNVLLNLFFIKKWGMLGAAYATLISQFFASIGSSIIFKKTYPILKIQLNALFLFGIINKILFNEERNNGSRCFLL